MTKRSLHFVAEESIKTTLINTIEFYVSGFPSTKKISVLENCENAQLTLTMPSVIMLKRAILTSSLIRL